MVEPGSEWLSTFTVCKEEPWGKGRALQMSILGIPQRCGPSFCLMGRVKLQGTREDPSERNQNSALLPASPLANCLDSIPHHGQEPELPTGARRSCCPEPHPGFSRCLPGSRVLRNLLARYSFVPSLLPISCVKISIGIVNVVIKSLKQR